MSQTRSFACPRSRLPSLIGSVERWLRGENFNCQTLTTDDGGTLLQVEKKGGWRKFVGMSTTLNVVFRPAAETVNVEIGAGRWIDKAVASSVGMLLLWPFAITSAIGTWQQTKMPGRVYAQVAHYLSQSGG